MRFAIVSDVHANMQAWKAVLLDIGSSRIDRIVCLGDIVGYGPRPTDVLESVYEHAHHVILGNHDAAVCGKLDESLFNTAAADIVRWTRSQLNARAMRFLSGLPMTLSGEFFRCSHGDLAAPRAFHYVIDPQDAMPSWDAVDDDLLFVGHSHDPAIFVLGDSGTPHRVDPQDFELESGKRFLVNVGSVGQPRDGDARAGYCIYDSNLHAVFFRRIPFDLDAYRQDLSSAGIDASASYFLEADPMRTATPVRELLSFRPPAAQEDQVQDVVDVAEIQVLHKAVSRWKRLTLLALVTLIGTTLIGGIAAYHVLTRARTITPPYFNLVSTPATPSTDNMLSFPRADATTPAPIQGWQIRLGHRRKQNVSWRTGAASPHFFIESQTKNHPIRVESRPIEVKAGMRFTFEAMVRMPADVVGAVQIDVTLWRMSDGELVQVDHFASDMPDSKRTDGWNHASETFDIPSGGSCIQVAIDGSLAGQAEIKDISLSRKR